jgi:hypothetical protein
VNAPAPYTLDIRVSMRDQYGRSNLEVSESLQIDAMGFFEIAQVLGQFHELAQKINAKAGGGDGTT